MGERERTGQQRQRSRELDAGPCCLGLRVVVIISGAPSSSRTPTTTPNTNPADVTTSPRCVWQPRRCVTCAGQTICVDAHDERGVLSGRLPSLRCFGGDRG